MKNGKWVRLLACVTVNQELLLQNEYLAEAWVDWRSALLIVKPETVIAWHRKG